MNQIGRAQAATEEAKKWRRQLQDTIQVAKSAQTQLRAAKRTIEERDKAAAERRARRAAKAKARPRMRAKAKASPAPKARPGSPIGREVREMVSRGGSASSTPP